MPDDFTRGYITCALWCGVYGDDPDSEPDYDCEVGDIDAETFATMVKDCADFQHDNRQTLVDYYNLGYDPDDAGHDFWLTRNGHGAGFWDRGLGEIGDMLTDACKNYREVNLFTVDGKVIQE
jgi:hypothetical protein